MSAADFLGFESSGDGSATIAMGRDLHGAFGGVFGGGIAAATLAAARPRAPGRRPFSLHCTFVRTLTAPSQVASAEVVTEGRTVTSVAVDLTDDEGGLVARATATFAEPDALHVFDADGPLRSPEIQSFEEAWELPVPEGVEAPVMETLPLRISGMPHGGYAHTIRAPWQAREHVAEGACMIADYCAGVPVGAAVGPEGTRIPVPNPDLSLRFVGDEWGEVLVGVGRLGRIDRGIAGTAVEVWTGPDRAWTGGDEGHLVAIGLSSAVMLAVDRR